AVLVQQEALARDDPTQHLEGEGHAEQHQEDAGFRRPFAPALPRRGLRRTGCRALAGHRLPPVVFVGGDAYCAASSITLTWSASAGASGPPAPFAGCRRKG